MTLVAAWIRQRKERDELVVASDSRLSFGARWDCCPKIFPLSRNDSVLAFCGDTAFAYPVLLQLSKSIENYKKSQSREMDITGLRPHFIKIIERMKKEVHDLPSEESAINLNDFKILFAGYSWKDKRFRAWSLFYKEDLDRFHFLPLTFHKRRTGWTKPFIFIGDHVREATGELYKLLGERDKLMTGALDMEPLEILTQFIKEPKYHEIAGPPQLVRVYPYAHVLPINVLWPMEKPDQISHFGRPLLSYEGSKYACLDLRNLELLSPVDANRRVES